MFNWKAAFVCFCVFGIFVSVFAAIYAFSNGDAGKGKAFIITMLSLAFMFGGLVFENN